MFPHYQWTMEIRCSGLTGALVICNKAPQNKSFGDACDTKALLSGGKAGRNWFSRGSLTKARALLLGALVLIIYCISKLDLVALCDLRGPKCLVTRCSNIKQLLMNRPGHFKALGMPPKYRNQHLDTHRPKSLFLHTLLRTGETESIWLTSTVLVICAFGDAHNVLL